MSELKTRPNNASVEDFLESIANETKKEDCKILHTLMERISGEKAVMWGDSIVGFGSYHYKYKSGRTGDWLLTGFSPRVQAISIYIMSGFSNYTKLLDSLGTHKRSVACLYVKKLSDINTDVLEEIISKSIQDTKEYWNAKQD